MRLRDLPIGTRVKDYMEEETFLIAAQNHPDYRGTMLLSEKIVRVACFDAKERDSSSGSIFENVKDYGNNNYALSNIHQWLNSGEQKWYESQHNNDTPPCAQYERYQAYPYDMDEGYLKRFSGAFIEALLEVDVPVLTRLKKDEGEVANVKAKVFLPSRTEIGKGDESGYAEGHLIPLFCDPTILKAKPNEKDLKKYGRSWNPERKDAPYDAPQIYHPKYGWWFFLRTPSLKYAFLVRVMSPYGAVSYTYAYNGVVGIRPIMNLNSDLGVDGNGEIPETYTIIKR